MQRKNKAATKIQSLVRGFFSRKKTNIYGESQGKEVEVYLPWVVRDCASQVCDYSAMIWDYGTIVCESSLFHIQIDNMNFTKIGQVKIPELVTLPVRQSAEKTSDLLTEEEVDKAVSDFLVLLEEFTQQAAQQMEASFILMNSLIDKYNIKHPKHPLRMESNIKQYLENPQGGYKAVPADAPVKLEIGFIYDKSLEPIFDVEDTPRTEAAATLIGNAGYGTGKLLVHVQKTFSLAVEAYRPEAIGKRLNNTPQQLQFMSEARQRAEAFLAKHPLPMAANREKIIGLLTLAVEQVLVVINSAKYQGLHEKADRPVLAIRHILHYVKKMVCNMHEYDWFDEMFRKYRGDIQAILCATDPQSASKYDERGYGYSSGYTQEKYDALFDLFGDFYNKRNLTQQDIGHPLNEQECQELQNNGVASWRDMYITHSNMSNRTHLRMQRVFTQENKKEYHPLFEARRIGLMTVSEFIAGQSQIPPPRYKFAP